LEDEKGGGPYSPYPVSFPKVLGGLLYFEKNQPKLATTPEQCEKLIPILDGMGRAWKQAIDMNKGIRMLLTPQQADYVFLIPLRSKYFRRLRIFNNAKVGYPTGSAGYRFSR